MLRFTLQPRTIFGTQADSLLFAAPGAQLMRLPKSLFALVAVARMTSGEKMMFVIPSWDLIVCWHTNQVIDFDASPADAKTKCNRAAVFIAEALRGK
jgi:hypothetical protein